jgi:hypothetical protein
MLMVVVIFAREGSLRARVACYFKLFWRQLFAPLLVGLHYLLFLHNSLSRTGIRKFHNLHGFQPSNATGAEGGINAGRKRQTTLQKRSSIHNFPSPSSDARSFHYC